MTETAAATLADELSNYADDPVGFAADVLNLEVDDWQKRFLEAVAEYPKVAVRSSTGQGKDFGGGIAVLWFLAQFWKAYCPCSANSEDQLTKILWKQFAELIDGSNGYDQVFEWQATAIRHRLHPAEWLAFAKTSNKKITGGGESHAEGSSGHHADNMLILLDEASGIEEVFWQAYEPTLTGPNNKIIAIGNPNRLSGSFYQIWYKPAVAGFWKRFTIAGRPSAKAAADDGETFISQRGNQSGNHDYLIAKWGVNHPIVQSKVFGVHPTISTDNTGYAFEEVRAAQSRVINPADDDDVQIGVDVARFGSNETVYYIRRGRTFRYVAERKQTIPHIVEKIIQLAEEEPDPTMERYGFRPWAVIDETGVGGGVVDGLRAAGYKNVRGVSFGGAARNRKAYFNLAAEMWLEDLKAYFECVNCGRMYEAHQDDVNGIIAPEQICPKYLPGISLPEDDELLGQLTARTYFFTGRGEGDPKTKIRQRAIQSKDDMVKKAGSSPDRADALCLAVVRPKMPGVF
jgi:phage terminase large subunit